MTCCQDDRTEECFARIRLYSFHFSLFDDQCIHPCLEVYLTSTFNNRIAHILYHPWQLVRADMRMGIYQNGRRSTMLAEYIEYLVHIPALLASGIQLSVRVCTGSSFTETVVRFWVYPMLSADLCQVFLTFAHILTTLHDDRTQPQFYQP